MLHRAAVVQTVQFVCRSLLRVAVWKARVPVRRRCLRSSGADCMSARIGMSSGVSPSSVRVGRCWLYERGQCQRGSSCRYLHDVKTVRSDHPGDSLTSVPRPQNGTPTATPCRYFLRTGRCAFGSKCRFSHCEKPLAAAEATDGGRESQAHLAQAAESVVCSDQPVPRLDSDRRKLCWFFRRGRCHFGEKCRHRHVLVSDKSVNEDQRPANGTRSRETVESRHMTEATETGRSNETVESRHVTEASETGQSSETVESRLMTEASETGRSSETVESMHTSVTEKGIQDVSVVPQTSHVTSHISSSVQKVGEKSDKLSMLRATEITQLCRRYPKAAVTETEDGSTTAKFIFEPSDPDWVMASCHLFFI